MNWCFNFILQFEVQKKNLLSATFEGFSRKKHLHHVLQGPQSAHIFVTFCDEKHA